MLCFLFWRKHDSRADGEVVKVGCCPLRLHYKTWPVYCVVYFSSKRPMSSVVTQFNYHLGGYLEILWHRNNWWRSSCKSIEHFFPSWKLKEECDFILPFYCSHYCYIVAKLQYFHNNVLEHSHCLHVCLLCLPPLHHFIPLLQLPPFPLTSYPSNSPLRKHECPWLMVIVLHFTSLLISFNVCQIANGQVNMGALSLTAIRELILTRGGLSTCFSST